jgi:hypothetical protein
LAGGGIHEKAVAWTCGGKFVCKRSGPQAGKVNDLQARLSEAVAKAARLAEESEKSGMNPEKRQKLWKT